VWVMADATAHGEPDDSGCQADQSAVLGPRRLTIIDLCTGHQPLANEDGTIWIGYNGESHGCQRRPRHGFMFPVVSWLNADALDKVRTRS
jgi:asparagine synthetase B (glutamine-hydrolysing)